MCRTSNFVRSIQNKTDACQYQCEHLQQISWKTLLIHKRFEVTVIRHGLVSTVKGLHSVLHRNVASVSKRPNASPRSHLRPRIKWQMLRYRLAHGSARQSGLGRSRAHHWYCTHWVIHDLHTNCTALPDSMHNCNKRLKNSDERMHWPCTCHPVAGEKLCTGHDAEKSAAVGVCCLHSTMHFNGEEQPPKLPPSVNLSPCRIHDSMGTTSPQSKRHIDWFSCFWRAHCCVQQTHTQTILHL